MGLSYIFRMVAKRPIATMIIGLGVVNAFIGNIPGVIGCTVAAAYLLSQPPVPLAYTPKSPPAT